MIPAVIAKVMLVALAVIASWLDFKVRRLPNWLSALAALTGLIVAVVNIGLPALGSHSLHMLAALLGGMALYALGLFGGGDAKFYAGTAAWFALGDAPRLLLSVTLSGLGLFIVWFVLRRIAKKPIRAKPQSDADKLPYGIAIALGAVIQYL